MRSTTTSRDVLVGAPHDARDLASASVRPAVESGLVAVALLALALLGFAPWWLPVAAALPVVAVFAVQPLLRSRGLTSLTPHLLAGPAKVGLLAGGALLVFTGEDPFMGPTVAALAQVLGWASALWGLALHWWVAAVRVWQVRTLFNLVPPVPRQRRPSQSRVSESRAVASRASGSRSGRRAK